MDPFRAVTAVRPQFDLVNHSSQSDDIAKNGNNREECKMTAAGQNTSKKIESSSGVLHIRLKFESIASTLGKNLANQAAVSRKRESERIVQEKLAIERAADIANAIEEEQEKAVEEERQRLQNKKSLFNWCFSWRCKSSLDC